MIFKHLRKFTKVIMWGIAIFIVPAFVIWNVGSAVRNRRSGFAGEIFQRKVSWKDFMREKQSARNDLWLRFGEQIRDDHELSEQAWTRLILREEAKRRNVTVSNEELIRHITTLPMFQYGPMDPRSYTEIIARIFQQSPADFEEGVRTSMMMGKLMEQVVATVAVSEEEIRQAYKNDQEKAGVDFIVISAEEFRDNVSIENERVLEEYFSAHADDFKKPAQVDVAYIEIKLEAFKDLITISPEQIEAYYEQHKEQYRIAASQPQSPAPEESAEPGPEYTPLAEVSDAIRDILIEREMQERAALQARDIMNRLYSEQNLENAAAAFGAAVQNTGPFSMLEEIPNVGLSFPFVRAAFALDTGEISEVIQTPTALYILQPREKIPPHVPAYEEVRERVLEAYITEHSVAHARAHAVALQERMNTLMQEQTKTFAEAAASGEQELISLGDITRTGYVSGIGYAEEFTRTAFSLTAGALSAPVQIPQGWAIMTVREIIPIDEQEFVDQRERYAQQVLAERKTTYLTDWFNALKHRANPVIYPEEDSR